MPFTRELLLLTGIPLTVAATLLIGHLTTLHGLRGEHRLAAFRILAEAMRRRR
ncbi:hypothetical protein [Streptomyces sp. TLI_146]|uniref:hypothetical protein n=1 Tax=Streptomyces sp. TLI_146 TaxID=1938858 RepID=UPI000CAF3F5A|nr:hypothetical protein [Streptomyces sp. TLI_146]PKV85090.1 hypothetical protein BX283_2625 [Streptomyces sp. TLI_146]